jgi:hypothetical protein
MINPLFAKVFGSMLEKKIGQKKEIKLLKGKQVLDLNIPQSLHNFKAIIEKA